MDEHGSVSPDSPTVAATEAVPTIHAVSTERPGTVIGRYKLLEQIGEGGFGMVYVAEQREPVKRRVALKIIKLGMDTRQVVARFEAERQALALMDHPNIAKVFDAGSTDTGRPYFVMELVRGVRITDYCDENHLCTAGRLELFLQVCHAIQHAHQKGIIHRDIKPSNILVTLHDGVPVPKVIDFGIAKATQQDLSEKTVYTQLQQFVGTPAYMSPEQAEMSGLDIDTRADVYSLGVVLYELLTGRTPFDGKELMASGIDAMRKTIREKEPVRPSTQLQTASPPQLAARRPPLATDLDWIVMKCLEKDRTRRYDTASALAQDILRHLHHEPVAARPASSLYRFRKMIRRNKLAVAAAAAFTAALLIGLAVSTWQFIQKNRAYRRAVAAEQVEINLRRLAQQAHGEEARMRARAEVQELAARRNAYASDMNLAQQALAVNNLGRAEELLNRHRPSALAAHTAADLRGWEWRYLWQQCRSDALFSLCQRSNSVYSLSASHEGKWLAVGEQEAGGLSVWDLRTRQEVAKIPAGDGRVRVAFSPRESLLAFTTVEGLWANAPQYRLVLWDAAKRTTGEAINLGSECMGLAFSADGQSIITSVASPGNQVSLWNVPSLRRIAEVPAPQVLGTVGTFFGVSRDLSVAVTRLADGKSIRVIALPSGRELWTAKVSDEGLAAIALSPDGNVIATAGGIAESAVRLWDIRSKTEIRQLEGHRGYVIGLLFWPDGKTLASASADQTIRLWDLSNSTNAPPSRVLRGHKLEVWSLSLLGDGATLASGSKDGSVYLWDTTASRLDHTFASVPASLAAWSFSADGKAITALDRQGRVSTWQGDDFSERKPMFDLARGSINSVKISPDGRFMAASSMQGAVKVWDLSDGKLLREFSAHSGPVSVAGWLSQGRKLFITRLNDNRVDEWDFSTGQKTHSLEPPPNYNYAAGAISRGEEWILAVGYGGQSRLRNIPSGRQTTLTLDIRQPVDADFSRDGKFFAVASKLGYARLWEREPLREVATFRGFLLGVHSVAFSPDGTRLAVGSNWKEAVKLWDTQSLQELLTLEGQGSYFYSSAFSPDGNILASLAGQSGKLHLWRAPSWEEIEKSERKN